MFDFFIYILYILITGCLFFCQSCQLCQRYRLLVSFFLSHRLPYLHCMHSLQDRSCRINQGLHCHPHSHRSHLVPHTCNFHSCRLQCMVYFCFSGTCSQLSITNSLWSDPGGNPYSWCRAQGLYHYSYILWGSGLCRCQ